MAVITKITTQQKSHERYNIYIDFGKGEEFAFSVDEDVLIKFSLKKGLELDDFSLMEIRYQDKIRKAYHSAISYLTKRIRSEKEITDYLLGKEIEEPVIQEVIHKLKVQKYIDDREYAFAYVRTQINTTDKGPSLIRMELKEKGIEKSLAEQAMAEYSVAQQLEKAVRLSKKFIEKNSRDSNKVLKQKLENLLVRKGFPYDVINQAVSEADLSKSSDEDLNAIRFQGEKAHRKFSKYSGFEYEQKMKQALYRKGFSLDVIEKFLAERNSID